MAKKVRHSDRFDHSFLLCGLISNCSCCSSSSDLKKVEKSVIDVQLLSSHCFLVFFPFLSSHRSASTFLLNIGLKFILQSVYKILSFITIICNRKKKLTSPNCCKSIISAGYQYKGLLRVE